MLKKIFDFWGMTCTILCGAGGFYFLSNRYYVIDGKILDFSIYAWLVLLLFWGLSGWLFYKKHNPVLFMFVFAVSFVSAVFDCYAMVMYAHDNAYSWYIIALEGLALLCFLGALYLRLERVSSITASVFILSFFGALFMYPQIADLVYVYSVAGVFVALWLITLVSGEKVACILRKIGVVLVITLICFLVAVFYFRLPGIRFYEAKITKPADKVKVSVVIPVYNAEEYIERCLDSLRKQSLKDIEIIAVDDGSTDSTLKILAKYAAHDARIKVIRQKNAYVGAARNRGLMEATGEYVGFIDNDDWVSEDYYESLYNAAKKENLDVAIVSKVNETRQSHMIFQKVEGKKTKNSLARKENILNLEHSYCGFVWNKIYRKSFLIDNNILFSINRTLYEDTYFSVYLYAILDDIAIADKGVYYHTTKERATESSGKCTKFTDELFIMLNKLEELLENSSITEAQKEKGLKIFYKYKKVDLANFYSLLKDEDKEKFYEICLASFDEESCQEAMETPKELTLEEKMENFHFDE